MKFNFSYLIKNISFTKKNIFTMFLLTFFFTLNTNITIAKNSDGPYFLSKTKLNSHKIPLGQKTYMNLSRSEWNYVLTDRYKYPVKLLQNKHYMDLTGVINSNIEVVGKNESVNEMNIMKQKCFLMKSAYLELSKTKNEHNITADADLISNVNQLPLCILNVDDGLKLRTSIFFITKRNGDTGKYSYNFHNITFNYPQAIKEKAQMEMKKFSDIIKFQYK
ncbi:MAG: hypothetical protein HQK51_00355 [Oligoflexia bacterium]|nr:hypothetical protein [Oligoflexia bacterium]